MCDGRWKVLEVSWREWLGADSWKISHALTMWLRSKVQKDPCLFGKYWAETKQRDFCFWPRRVAGIYPLIRNDPKWSWQGKFISWWFVLEISSPTELFLSDSFIPGWSTKTCFLHMREFQLYSLLSRFYSLVWRHSLPMLYIVFLKEMLRDQKNKKTMIILTDLSHAARCLLKWKWRGSRTGLASGKSWALFG